MASDVDQDKIQNQISLLQNIPSASHSGLADILRSPDYSQAERDALIGMLAEDPQNAHLFLGGEALRILSDDPKDIEALREDQRVIGEAVQKAMDAKKVSPEQLLALADEAPAGGAQSLMSVLRNGGGGPDGTVAALSDALWERADKNQAGPNPDPQQIERDRAVAAIGYLSDPQLQAERLGSPEPDAKPDPSQALKRREAFEALVGFNEKLANEADFPNEAARSAAQKDAAAAAGQLFVSNGQELVDQYAGVDLDTSKLATFFKQGMFNPETRDAPMRDGQPLAEAVAGKVNEVSSAYLDTAQASAPGGSQPDPEKMKDEMTKLGHLAAGLQGGIRQALSDYSDRITEHEHDRAAFAKSVGMAVGVIPVPGGKLVGAGVKAGTDPLLKAIYDYAVDPPDRPDLGLGVELKDHFERRAEAIGADAGIAFRSGHGSEADDLQLGQELKGFERHSATTQTGSSAAALADASSGQLFDRLVAARVAGDPAAMDRALNQAAHAEVNRDLREQAVASVDVKQQAALEAQQRSDQTQVEERSRGARSIG